MLEGISPPRICCCPGVGGGGGTVPPSRRLRVPGLPQPLCTAGHGPLCRYGRTGEKAYTLYYTILDYTILYHTIPYKTILSYIVLRLPGLPQPLCIAGHGPLRWYGCKGEVYIVGLPYTVVHCTVHILYEQAMGLSAGMAAQVRSTPLD